MRQLLSLTVAVTLVLGGFAGCLESIGTASNDNATDSQARGHENTTAELPDPINASETVTGSADPLGPAQEPCSSPSADCDEYPFTLETTATLDAQLTWTQQASDFDLYLYKDDQQQAGNAQLEASGSDMLATSENFSVELEPGTYTIAVQASAVAEDTYTVKGAFSYA